MKLERYKIAVVIPKYGLTEGAEGFAAELTERIDRDRRCEINLFANRWTALSEKIIFHKIPVISFPKFLTTLSFAWFARRLIAKEDFAPLHRCTPRTATSPPACLLRTSSRTASGFAKSEGSLSVFPLG